LIAGQTFGHETKLENHATHHDNLSYWTLSRDGTGGEQLGAAIHRGAVVLAPLELDHAAGILRSAAAQALTAGETTPDLQKGADNCDHDQPHSPESLLRNRGIAWFSSWQSR